MVLVVVDDLIFLSKIEQTARTLGIPIEAVGSANARDRVTSLPGSAVIIDLNHRSGEAVETIRAIKSDPAANSTRVIGFLSHVQGELAAAARAAGCDEVMARSAFNRQLAQLLRELAQADSKARDGGKRNSQEEPSS